MLRRLLRSPRLSSPLYLLLLLPLLLLLLMGVVGVAQSVLGWRRRVTRANSFKRPQQLPHPQSQRVLVLDLDETLVHSTTTRLPEAAPEGAAAAAPPVEVMEVVTGSGVRVRVRPGARTFLRRMAAAFDEVVIFTAATREYADAVISKLDPAGTLIGRRLYREHCDVVPSSDGGAYFVKNLRKLWVPLRSVLLVDNTPSCYELQPLNGVPIPSFFGDARDTALAALTPLLLAAAKDRAADVRDAFMRAVIARRARVRAMQYAPVAVGVGRTCSSDGGTCTSSTTCSTISTVSTIRTTDTTSTSSSRCSNGYSNSSDSECYSSRCSGEVQL